MRIVRALASDRRAAAAAEMAMIAPILLALFFGSAELGNYFYNEHKLVKAVRDGARYAARQSFSNYDCAGTGVPQSGTPGSVYENTKLRVRKGKLDTTAPDLLPRWSGVTASCAGNPAGGCFEMTMSCTSQVVDPTLGNLTLQGIYANVPAPTVVVSASIPYRTVLGGVLGFEAQGIVLNARQSAAVAGV